MSEDIDEILAELLAETERLVEITKFSDEQKQYHERQIKFSEKKDFILENSLNADKRIEVLKSRVTELEEKLRIIF